MAPKAAAIYVRISDDPTGERAGVQRQRTECAAKAAQRGWSVDPAHVFEDNDISASKGKARPGYEALLAAVQSGEVQAIVAWHPDRLTRQPVELERFIDVVEAAKADVDTVSAGPYDLTTPAGRMTARIVGATARYEVEQKTARTLAANRQSVSNGRSFKGRDRLFGYTHSTEPQIVEDEAAIIRELAQRALKGETLRSLAADLNDRGIKSTRGNRFTAARVKELLTNQRLTGTAVYEGETYQGKWKPILSAKVHRQLVTLLTAPERLTSGGSTARKALLPGFLYCGTCGCRMYSATSSKSKTYSCKQIGQTASTPCGSMNIRREPVEAAVRERVILLLSQMEEGIAASSELADAVDEITDLEARIDALDVDHYVNGTVTVDSYKRLHRMLTDKRTEANRAASEATFGAALSMVPRDAVGIAKAYDEGSLDFKRALIDTTIDRIVINKPTKAGSVNVDPADRVEIHTRLRFYGEGGIAPKSP